MLSSTAIADSYVSALHAPTKSVYKSKRVRNPRQRMKVCFGSLLDDAPKGSLKGSTGILFYGGSNKLGNDLVAYGVGCQGVDMIATVVSRR